MDAERPLKVICWKKRELENYFATPAILIKHVKLLQNEYPKYTQKQLEDMMANVIKKYTIPAYLEDLNDEWWNDAKLSDEWLDKIFPEFYKQLRLDKNSFNFNMFGSCHQQHTDEMQHKKQELQSWLPRIDR